MRAGIPIHLLFALRFVTSQDIAACVNREDGCDAVTMLQSRTKLDKDSTASIEAIDHARHLSLDLANLFAGLAAALPKSDTQKLFESFRLCGQCSSFRRFGESNDGGYLMCMDAFKNKTMQAAYSFGGKLV